MTAMTKWNGLAHTALTVGQVAERLGVTVRTLHRYDAIGLVVPSERTPAGYRLYTVEDLTRLQHVVCASPFHFVIAVMSYRAASRRVRVKSYRNTWGYLPLAGECRPGQTRGTAASLTRSEGLSLGGARLVP